MPLRRRQAAEHAQTRPLPPGPHALLARDSALPDLTDALALLADPGLRRRGSGPVRGAVVQRLQQAVGNQATRRALQHGGRVPTAPPRSRVVIQRKLAADSTGVDLVTILQKVGVASDEMRGTLGWTTVPKGYQAPQYARNVESGRPFPYLGQALQYWAGPKITSRANEGANTSDYLTTGIYQTGYGFDLQSYNQYGNQYGIVDYLTPYHEGDARVYYVMGNQMAQLNHTAEVEHCNDNRYAYQITLAEAERALTALGERRYGPYDNQQAAENAYDTHFANDFDQALKPVSQGLGTDPGGWANAYARAYGKSKVERDDKQWHLFTTAMRGQAPQGKPQYLTGKKGGESEAVYLDVTQGPTMNVGNVASATVITLA